MGFLVYDLSNDQVIQYQNSKKTDAINSEIIKKMIIQN